MLKEATSNIVLTQDKYAQNKLEKKIEEEGSKWTSKSLNSLPTEHYEMDISNTLASNKHTKQKDNKAADSNQKILPQPKIKKVNEKTFCLTIDNQINIFYHLDQAEKAKLKITKKNFGMLKYQIESNIEFVAGNGTNYIFVGTLSNLIILQLYKKQDKYFVEERTRKQIPNLKAVTFIGKEIIAVSSNEVYQLFLDSISGSFDLVAKKIIGFPNQSDKKLFGGLKSVGLIVESIFCFYFFGIKVEEKVDYHAKRKYTVDTPPPSKMCQVLHIVKFQIEHNMQYNTQEDHTPVESSQTMMTRSQIAQNKIISIKIQMFPIDHVFQTGIFQKSKIFQIGQSVFLMSLHQEIILIKKHFNKFIVWDNVSIMSSKSQQKKGQLILADKRILVYSENCEIFARDIFFNEAESRISMPPIDGFKGNDNDEQILYDAVLLEYDKESLMKVLFYFKECDVILPNKSKYRKQHENNNDPTAGNQNTLAFTMLCINQSDPKEKLMQMLKVFKKQPNDINQFCERFKINQLEKTKCMWSVSEKSLKDIQNVLLEIADDKYIQTELDNILKKQPHNLTFLISVEKKQIARLKKLTVKNLLNDHLISQNQNQMQAEKKKRDYIKNQNQNQMQAKKKKRDYIKKVIQWLMESIMFKKKLEYSKNFLSFKEYDFIQIGKLKAASLKEEIKLLSCKKYEKRLKYFLNSFKILAIANWEQIFRFLLANKNQIEIKEFLKDFRFILPQFAETSAVFQAKKSYNIHQTQQSYQSDVLMRTNRGNNGNSPTNQPWAEQTCYLWHDIKQFQPLVVELLKMQNVKKNIHRTTSQQQNQKSLNTVQDFRDMIIQIIKSFKKESRFESQAIQNFICILKQIVDSPWFNNAAFKQHSMLNKTSRQLQKEFAELKDGKAYQILMKYLYQQLEKPNVNNQITITVSGINRMLEEFVQIGLIPESFKKNDDARLQVYKFLERKLIPRKQQFKLKKSQYLVLNEDEYFSFLFQEIRSQILTTVKDKYDKIEDGFFRERFQIYLNSTYVNLRNIISFLDDFKQGINADDVRIDVFNCIKRLLRLGDYENTKSFIEKSLDKQVLPDSSNQEASTYEMNLRQQAKIPYGFVFFNFFKAFNLDYTYQELIRATQNANLASNNFLKELIHKYCAGMYETETDYDGRPKCQIYFEDNKIINERIDKIDIHGKPLQFFGIVLYLIDVLDFQVEEISVYHLMIEQYLNEGKNYEVLMFHQQLDKKHQIKSPYQRKRQQFDSKFKELFSFASSISNYIMTGQDLNTKNYILINDFKDENDAEQIFVDYTIQWISRNYSFIQNIQEATSTLTAIQNVITILEDSRKSTRKVKQCQAFFRMLQFIKKFSPEMMTKVDFIKKEMDQNTGFIFLIHMFKAIGVQNFINSSMDEEGADDSMTVTLKRGPSQFVVKIYNWNCIYSQFNIIKGGQTIDQKDSPDFIRFIIEVCCIMINEGHYKIAWDFLLRSVNQSYYFRDAFYYFASQVKIEDQERFRQSLRAFLNTETTKNLKSKLNAMKNGNAENGLQNSKVISIPQSRESVDGRRIKNDIYRKKQASTRYLFKQLLSSGRPDEAFFFLIRIRKISMAKMEQQAKVVRKLSELGLYSYLLLTSYMKCLQKYISEEFYPTFLFFKSKYEILIDQLERKDIIKDVNIALSRLKKRIEQKTKQAEQKTEQTVKAEIVEIVNCQAQLKQFYQKYMNVIEQNPIIKLTQKDQDMATKRLKSYARMTNNLLQDQNREEENAKLKLQDNQKEIQKVHQKNKLNVIHKEIQESVSEAKKAADKYAAILQQKKKQASKKTYAQKKQEQLLQIRRKEDQDVSSIKDSFKSNTTQRVNELIEELRLKRQKVNQNRYKSSVIRDREQQANIPSKDSYFGNQRQKSDTNAPERQFQAYKNSKYNIQVRNPIGVTQKVIEGAQLMDRKLKGQRLGTTKTDLRIHKQQLPSEQYQKRQKKKMEESSITTKSKITSGQISKMFREKEPDAVKYLEKFDLIKQNMQVGVELTKRVFSVIKDLSNFVQFIHYLMHQDDRYRDVLEQKCLSIVSQMIKMDQKLDLKELIPIQAFITVHKKSSIKEYYNEFYSILRPNLRKVMEKEKVAVHALGILMRYSLGSETKYFHRVFEDYISVLLKNYDHKVFDDKETFLLAEKLRSQYSNLESQGRQFKFEKLIKEVTNDNKRKRLVSALNKAIQRKNESVIGGSQTEQISRAVSRLSSE